MPTISSSVVKIVWFKNGGKLSPLFISVLFKWYPNLRKRGDHDPKAKKKKKRIDSHQGGNSPTLQGSLKSNDEQGIVEKSQFGDCSIITRSGSFIKDNYEDSKLQHEKISPKASRPDRRSNKHPPEHYHKGNGVASVMDNGKAANISEGRNGSLAALGSIFREGSCESSEDEGGHAISDASTKTPSDYTVSSDTDGESNTNLTSPQDAYRFRGPKKKKKGWYPKDLRPWEERGLEGGASKDHGVISVTEQVFRTWKPCKVC